MNIQYQYFRYRKIVNYLFFNYMEFGIFALISIYFSSVASSEELASSSVSFIIISYSAFASLGLFSALIKESAISGRDRTHINYIIKVGNIYVVAVFSIFAFMLYLLFVNLFNWERAYVEFISFGLLIGGMNLVKSYCQSYFRIYKLDKALNVTNLSWVLVFGFCFLIGYFLFAFPLVQSFFVSWALGLILCYGVALIHISRKVFREKNITRFSSVTIIASSFHLFLNSVNLTLILTFDRLLLNFIGADVEIIAKFQFSDMISNIFFLGFSSVIYYLTPNMIYKFSNSHDIYVFRNWLKQTIVAIIFLSIVFFLMVLVYLNIINRFEYDQAMILLLHIIFKGALIVFGLFVMFLHSVRKERMSTYYYIFIVTFVAISVLLFQQWCVNYNSSLQIYISTIPISIIAVTSTVLYFHMKNKFRSSRGKL
ncbi:hypothetical protein [Vibrio penaeicida]|uniref:hypothetical protein n=1 Tax=Vibrio penaeicida TaxID=104609 RepID=UPI000CE9FCE8|nr:hypothetical protein [Vibrio penaeicida]